MEELEVWNVPFIDFTLKSVIPKLDPQGQRKLIRYFWYLKKHGHKFTCENIEHQKKPQLFSLLFRITSIKSAMFIMLGGSVSYWFYSTSLMEILYEP